ncbi:MAG: alpha/beta hydrolase [Actinomycetia bacterium]|nr:alpha/beta hydrolase [Actinomycetes bacterium]
MVPSITSPTPPSSAPDARHARRELVETRLGYIHVRLAGTGGPPLVLLHMSPLSGAMFEPIVDLLAASRLVVAPDRIGFGHSDRLAEPPTIAEYALATLDCLDALGIEQFDVLGSHTGSVEAVEFAVSQPARVRRVCVVGMVVYDETDRRSFRERYVPPPEPVADGSHLDFYREWWDGLRLPEWDATFIHDRLFDHLDSSPDFWLAYRAILDHPHTEQLSQITQPFLVLAPRDHLHEQTHAARGILPPHTVFVDVPSIVCDEPFRLASGEVAAHLEPFLSSD